MTALSSERLAELNEARKLHMRSHPDPIIDRLMKARQERDLVRAAEINLQSRTEYGLYANDEQRQADIDYITEHRLAAICHQLEADRLQAADYANWQDWVDTNELAVAAMRSC